MTVPADILNHVVADFQSSQDWHFQTNPIHRHQGFFVRRRADRLGTDNPAWLVESDLHSLKGRIQSELDALMAYLISKLGESGSRGPLYGGAGDVDPPHLDLSDVAQRKVTEPSTTVAEVLATPGASRVAHRGFNNFETRRMRIHAICWRAAAIHDQLWQPSSDLLSATLPHPPAALDELLDRRLRIVERMNYNVSSHGAMGGDEVPLYFDSVAKGWLDGFRVRLFEYPRVDKRRYAAIIGSDVASPPTAEYGGPKNWYDENDGLLWWNAAPYPGIRFPPTIAQHFQQVAAPGTPDHSSSYRLRLVPSDGKAAADVIDLLFPSTGPQDRWDRSWIFCDHLVAALHFEALRFARKRREGGSDATFNGILSSHYPGYVSLNVLISSAGSPDWQELGADTSDTVFFENKPIPENDLQVGDHLIFWNSFAYHFINQGEWSLENTIVMDVDSDPITGGHRRSRLKLQGHGTGLKLYAAYIKEVGGYFAKSLKNLQSAVRSFAQSSPLATEIPWLGDPHRVVNWSPYETWPAPGAWWVRIPSTDWGSDAAAAAAIHKAVAADDHPGAGYTPPPATGFAYFPLFEPNYPGGWAGYLAQRRTDSTFRPRARNLINVQVDGMSIPGLFHDGARPPDNTIPILRPRVSL